MAYAKPYATIARENLKIVKRIAQGGFGIVYKATWEDQVVAAKRVNKEEGETEVKFLSQLDHPNIVKFLGMVDNEVDVDVVLEFCDGGSLRDYLDSHRGTHLGPRFYEWAKQAGRPIAYLKTKQVVHKDIKSPNYLITSGNILKLCDFGLAKRIDATMTTATERASYPWMAPELLKDSVLSPTYDIFAYGVVVWELWTTDVPFEGCESVNVMYRICHNNERPPIPQRCPKQMVDLMKQCWETDWKKRPSMKQALALLESAEHPTSFITATWELVSEFGHQDGPGKLTEAKDIAVCPNGDIAVVDFLNTRVCVYSNKAAYKFHLEVKKGMNKGATPRNVAVNADSIFYVTCNQNVLMYTAQGEYSGRWSAMSPENKPSDRPYSLAAPFRRTELSCLTIDNNDQLLVGQVCHPMYISKHRQNGFPITSIKVKIAPYYLAATSHATIVISDAWMSNTVQIAGQIVDSTGNVLHTLNTDTSQLSFWNPCGISCHNDTITVCNCDNNNTHQISCFSVSAEYLGYIPVGKRPSIAKDNGTLVVARYNKALLYKQITDFVMQTTV